ncbi:LytTR family DNA-binding domain-containing protein [Macellibacteroides fermentans]|jgi:DNA-binding LytR/AlgR family response regulator|uniref:Transcriptional regulatory protein BtsR n=1 Tax=bioreactor metagenome TaxID=1076179 RepID=A0A644UKD5_9ZZZZ|nr:response regulator transcription factor [Parabacteroides sp.]MDT3369499.1 LytTR family DNA-binding domain-containing protein [Bacteroidota bacterium]HAD02528.1 DNA-binding response regulator [Porphyromonadaceae bacterium]HML69895.1 LytTR family DNA-binding domain-containing protein [Macellibacteroides fermentans]HNP90660.1 LytTR family DNA-binding domain-containing protein [Macellibacteroides fermentans]
MKLKCIITDDEPIARKGLQSYVERIDFLELVGVCEDAIQLNNQLKSQQADLLFLDIEMPYMTGIELLNSLSNPPKVIITSAYAEYAIKGYDLEVSDYLLKPISFDRFLKAVNKVYDQLISSQTPVVQDYLFVKTSLKLEKIRFNDMRFIEGVENYVAIYTSDGKIITHTTLRTILQKLPPERFVQVHKSYLVNIDKIDSIEGNLLGIGKNKIPLSRTYKETALEIILKNKLLKDG